jgi:hypothetical protein
MAVPAGPAPVNVPGPSPLNVPEAADRARRPLRRHSRRVCGVRLVPGRAWL